MLLGPTIFFSKEAILLLYFEIFHVKKSMKIAILVGMVFHRLCILDKYYYRVNLLRRTYW